MIGILNTYHIDPNETTYQKEYGPMLEQYLRDLLPEEEVKSFVVAQDEFPSDIYICDVWVITGSPASVYENKEWLKKLTKFIIDCDKNKIKILGFCFGHQMIAHALGGVVENSTKGWGVGVRDFKIVTKSTWMDNISDNCSLLFSHQDQVVKLPANAKLLGTDSFCPNQMYSIDEHIFSIQGHPEFTKQFAKDRYDSRVDSIGQQTYDEAIDSLSKTVTKEVHQWIKKFIKM